MCQVTIQAVEKGADMYAPTKMLIPDNYGIPEKSGLTADIKAGNNPPLKFDLQ